MCSNILSPAVLELQSTHIPDDCPLNTVIQGELLQMLQHLSYMPTSSCSLSMVSLSLVTLTRPLPAAPMSFFLLLFDRTGAGAGAAAGLAAFVLLGPPIRRCRAPAPVAQACMMGLMPLQQG